MSGRLPAIEQARSSKKHRARANRADSPDAPGDFSQPVYDLHIYFVALDGATAGDEQGVDFAPYFAKSFMRDDSQAAVRHQRALRRRADDFDGIDGRVTGIASAVHFRGASEDLKWPNQIEDLGAGRRDEHDSPRARWDWLLIIKVRAGLAVYSFHRLVASSCQFDSSPTPLLGRGGEAKKFESTHSFWLVTCHVARLPRRRSPRRPKAGHHSLKTGLWTEFTESAESFL